MPATHAPEGHTPELLAALLVVEGEAEGERQVLLGLWRIGDRDAHLRVGADDHRVPMRHQI